MALKVGVMGKGGAGKTTVTALLARVWSDRGARVVAIDTDSSPNLGLSLGLPLEALEAIEPIPPFPSDDVATPLALLERYGAATPGGATLLTALRVARARSGGLCGGHAAVRNLLADDRLTETTDVALVDMEAGLEHLSRAGGTLSPVDVLLVVIEPSPPSVMTAARTVPLARELGIPLVYGVGNKLRRPDDHRLLSVEAGTHDLPLAGALPYDEAVVAAEREGSSLPALLEPQFADAVGRVVDRLEWVTAPRR